MGSIVSILVFSAIYLVIYVAKNLISSPGDASKNVMGESFPSIEPLEQEDVPFSEQPVITAHVFDDEKPQKKQSQKPSPYIPEKKQVEQPADEPKEHKERLVKLQSKSDAKRAFLYSEIFNRKY